MDYAIWPIGYMIITIIIRCIGRKVVIAHGGANATVTLSGTTKIDIGSGKTEILVNWMGLYCKA